MHLLPVIALVLVVACGPHDAVAPPVRQVETITVPRLHGDDVKIPAVDLLSGKLKLTPLGWAMLLDMCRADEAEQVQVAFARACQADPNLGAEVVRLTATKSLIEIRLQAFRHPLNPDARNRVIRNRILSRR